jgi:hypothetical protein
MATQLPMRETSVKVWADTLRVIQTYPVIWIVSLLVSSMITTVAGSDAVKAVTENATLFSSGWLLDAFLMLVPLLVLIPAALLTHRLIVLGLHESLIQVLSRLRRVRLYAALEAVFVAILMIPLGLFIKFVSVEGDDIAIVATLGFVATLVAIFWLMFRSAAMYPAIAMDTDVSGIKTAFRATRGRTWNIAAIAFLTSGPIILAIIVLNVIGPSNEHQRLLAPWRFLSDLLLGASSLLWIVSMSNVYLKLVRNHIETDPRV